MAIWRQPAVRHFTLLAACISAAKVLLYTGGTTVVLARGGVEELPLFYVALALLAVALSTAFALVVDRLAPMCLAGRTLAAWAIAGAALFLAVGALPDGPFTRFLALASGHIYDILSDIVFWVAAALYLTGYQLRTASPWIYAATAAGGVVGGGLAVGLAQVAPAEVLFLATTPLLLLAVIQIRLATRRLPACEGDERDEPSDEASALDALRSLPGLLRRHPLAILLVLNSFMLTLVYTVSEYLAFATYESAFADEARLASFLAVIFAVLQVGELVLLLFFGPRLLQRATPVWRSVAFPLAALGSLVVFWLGPKLPAAVLTHLVTESVSNALFEPANNANYAALPRRVHGRVRTLADGILYPIGMAAGGLLLMAVHHRPSAALALGMAAAGLFVLLNVILGRRYVPAIVRNLRDGVAHFADLGRPDRRQRAEAAGLVRALARGDAEARRFAFQLAGHVDAELPADTIEALLADPDPELALLRAELVGRMPVAVPRRTVERLGASARPEDALLALRLLLARPSLARRAAALPLAAGAPLVAAVRDALSVRHRSAADLADAVVAASPEQQAMALAALFGAAESGPSAGLETVVARAASEALVAGLAAARAPTAACDRHVRAFARACLGHAYDRVRLAAVRLAGVKPRVLSVVDLGRALEDPAAVVRAAAAVALGARGDDAVGEAAPRLRHTLPMVRDAARAALGRIGSRSARAALAQDLEPDLVHARLLAPWRPTLAAVADRPAWAALLAALAERDRSAVAHVLATLAALGHARTVAAARDALAGDDPRRRADALEALASLPCRAIVVPALPLLEVAFGQERAIRPTLDADAVLRAARSHPDGWVRRAADAVAAALAPPDETTTERFCIADAEECTMERVLALKRVSFFRNLPVDTLLRVARLLEERSYEPGERIGAAVGDERSLYVLLRGRALVTRQGQPPRLVRAQATFGETCLVDETAAPPEAFADAPSVVLRMSAVTFADLAQAHPEIWREVCRTLARRLADVEDAPLAIAA